MTARLDSVQEVILHWLEASKEEGLLEDDLRAHASEDMTQDTARGKKTAFGQALSALLKDGQVCYFASQETNGDVRWFKTGFDPISRLNEALVKLTAALAAPAVSARSMGIIFVRSVDRVELPEYVLSRPAFPVIVEACPPNYEGSAVAIAVRHAGETRFDLLPVDGRLVRIGLGPGVPDYNPYKTVLTGLSDLHLIQADGTSMYRQVKSSDPVTIAFES